MLARFLWPLPWAWPAKLGAALVLLTASQYHLFCLLSSGSVFSPEFPRALVIAFNWAFGAILLLALLQLLVDVGTLLAMLARRRRLRIPRAVRHGIAGAALVLAAIGVHQAIRVPPVHDVEIAIAGLPPQFDGYRVLQLTDLHISRLFERPWTAAMVQRANALDADLVVITGDLIDGVLADRLDDVAPLGALQARDGVYVVPGNHEYFFGYPVWMRHFAALGMTPLVNAHAVIARDDAALVLAGVADVSATGAGFPAPDVAAALAGAPTGAPVLLLDHQPRNARAAAAQGVALQLSGHTHGGLIVGLDRVFALANAGFVSRRYAVDGMQLYVNNGTALWPGMALRLGKPSELTRITLRRAPDARG
ncbi:MULTISPECIES: metallophosphoesterase [Luteimonas]|uniref:metallophosphoesterase n=1 Tax=Luteimonas TaxID=83614 RepID=UPI001E4B4337|nr:MULTISPECIES: metallophosphoesterase [Luteimonas]